MKMILILGMLATCTFNTNAQVVHSQSKSNDDQIRQTTLQTSQRTIQPTSNVEAVKAQSNSELSAEINAKEKAQTQRQTKVQPVGINPDEPDATPKDLHQIPPLFRKTLRRATNVQL